MRVESKNPNMKEDDFVSASSKEEAEEILTERVGKSVVKLFGESKWQDKVQGYEKLTDWLFEEGIPLDMIEHSFRFIKG